MMVAIWFAVKYGRVEVSPEKINTLVEGWIHDGYLTDSILIKNYNAIYTDLGLPVEYRDEWSPTSYVCGADEIEHLCWKNGNMKHFTAGNGRGVLTYDPMGRAKTVREGVLDSKRIMRIV
jgi:hypothetical protein